MKRKICVVITARPSYSRIKSVLRAIKKHPDLELQLVVSGSALLERYGNVVEIMRTEGFEPDAVVYMLVEGENLVTSAKSTGMGIIELATVFNKLKPDAVLSVADRYETIATAITGAYLNIPVVHVQGGEVTGSIDEKVRHAVTKLSDLHFVSSQAAAKRVERMGERTETIFVTGCPSVDLAAEVIQKNERPVFEEIDGIDSALTQKTPYLVVLHHPVTYEWESAGEQMWELLTLISGLNMPTLWFWPNIDAGAESSVKAIHRFRKRDTLKNIHYVLNLMPERFLMLIKNSACLVGNSSVGIRESAYLGVPVVNIGSRQRGRDRGPNVIDVPHDVERIILAIKQQIMHGPYSLSSLYGEGNAGKKIADLLATVELTSQKLITY